MDVHDLVQSAPSWLSGSDDAGGIVISCRARLARNLAAYPFAACIAEAQQGELIETILEAATRSRRLATANYLDMGALDRNDRRVLVERHLISPALADGKGKRAVLFNADESLSVMVNEEDHLRLQAIVPGQRGAEAWGCVNALDDEISSFLPLAFSEKLGYLTACPTNTGTGLRVSVLMHLPALVLTEDMERVIQGLKQLSFTVRGVYGEGTNAAGNLFQVSNQATLGKSEKEIVEGLIGITRRLVEFEQDAQETLVGDASAQVEDKVWRAFGLLCSARILSSQEFMNLLSAVRLGFSLDIIKQVPPGFMNYLMIITQPAHLQADARKGLHPEQRDLRRAAIVRNRMAELGASTGVSSA